MKVKVFDKEWEVNPITYKQKRELWQLSLNAFREEKENEDDYFKLINNVSMDNFFYHSVTILFPIPIHTNQIIIFG